MRCPRSARWDCALNPADAETFLTKIFNNPPSAVGSIDGLILPEGVDPMSVDGWVAVLNYDDSGHVSDSDHGFNGLR